MKANELIHKGLYKVSDEVVIFFALNGNLYKSEGGLGRFFGKVYEDSEIGKLEVQLENGVWEEVKPIPLTEEILKANGWEETRLGHVYKKSGVPFRVYIGEADLWLDNEWDDYYATFSLAHIHQLQMAFRLCGLNDLADNLKI